MILCMGYAHGIRWTDEAIVERLMEVKNALELERMPTRSECENHYHNTALTNVISRRKGWYKLAKELGLPIKECETTFGKKYELLAESELTSHGYEVQRMTQNHPYDLLVEKSVKIDVKASRLFRAPSGNFYAFNLEKKYATCDFFLLYAISDDGIERTLIVPSNVVMSQKQISVGEQKSKYYKYENAWYLIEQTVRYWNDLSVIGR